MFEQYLGQKKNAGLWLLYKHSPTCPISQTALRQVEKFLSAHADFPIFMIDVLSSGDLKYTVADDLGIGHESPQAILFDGEKVRDHASHMSVSARWLTNAVDGWNDTR